VAPESVVEELKAFGLSTYEAEAYEALLLAGPSEASLVAQKAGIPSGRVYDVLNSLVEKKLLALHDTRPKQYSAFPPRVALSNLLLLRKKELDERYAQLTRLASDVEKRLGPRVREKDSSFYHVCIGEAESRTFLAQKVGEARDEILVALEFKRYDPLDEELFDAFSEAVQRGVRVRVLLRDEEIPYILESPYNALIVRTMLPHLGKSLEVGISSGEQVPFGIIDGEKAMIAVKNPLDPRSYFALVFVWDPKFGRDLRERFETRWKEAETELPRLLAE
jgi:sugar-specific transcriptional regulator TrmB